jgi:UDP-N-acetylglucosamine 3-dehydrogenase
MSNSQPVATPLRVGVVGLGVMGKNHARVLAELPGVTLAGVADPDGEQVDFVTSRLGCPGFASLDALMDAGIDARIIDAATRAGVTLMVGHVERFNPAVQSIRQAIAGDDILSIQITRVGPFPPRMSDIGVVIDLAVHDIDLIRWFTGSEIAEIQPQTNSIHAEREDIALLQFRTQSGVLAHINTNWLTPFKARTVHVATRNKYISGDLITRQVTECFDYKPDGSYSMRHLSVAYAEPLRAELVAFVEAVTTGTAPVTGGADGLASLDIAMRCLGERSAPLAQPKLAAGGRG